MTIVHEFETKEKKELEAAKQKTKEKEGATTKAMKRTQKQDEI